MERPSLMHKDFAEWYRLAGMEPDADKLPKRWKAIEDFAAGRVEVVALTRLFWKIGIPNEKVMADFRAAFQKTDPTFQMRGNEQEMAMLAGAELVDMIERGKRGLSDMSALALVCAGAQNLRHPALVADIPEFASKHLIKRSLGRTSEDPADAEDEGTPDPDKAALAQFRQQGAPFEAAASVLERLMKRQRSLALELPVVAEESNMLWWLFSEHSRDLARRWDKVPVSAAAVVAGKELAGLTRVIPGPIAATAFLDRVIRCAKRKTPADLPLVDAVNSLPFAWRQNYLSEVYVPDLEDITPISRGIKLSVESPENNAWVPAFVQATSIPANSEIAPSVLAYQTYLEGLLCQVWNMLK